MFAMTKQGTKRLNGAKRYVPHLLIGALVGMLCTVCPAMGADSLSGTTAGGYGRLTFTLDGGAPRAQVSGSVLVLTFPGKTTLKSSDIVRAMPGYVSNGRVDADGKTFRFALTQPLRVQTSSAGGKTAVDLMPPGFKGNPPPLRGIAKKSDKEDGITEKAVDMDDLQLLKVRSGAYRNFTRVVFDWPRTVSYSVSAAPGRLRLRFGAPIKPDFSAMERAMPPWVKPAGWHVEGASTIIDLTTDSDSGYHDFRDGAHVVVDILAPKTDAGAYLPPGTARPGVSSFRDKDKNASMSVAQADEIHQAATKLNNPKMPSPQVVAADGKPTATPTGSVQVQGRATRDGAELSIPGAASRGVAAFARGNTAWIVLQGAPTLDISKLKGQQSGILESADTVTSNGVSVLRLTLKKPGHVSVAADNGNLRVTLGGQLPNNVQNITFTRGQDDAARAALIASLEGAGKTVTLNDPGAKDKLIAIPGTLGQAVLAERGFVDFTMLPTAAGIVIEPFVDDLSIAITAPRVEITRGGGLSLSQGGAGGEQSFQPATASESSFLDYAHWGRMTGGSFLATERNLREQSGKAHGSGQTHADPAHTNPSRLNLARFYLANDFGAEALGLVNLMQTGNNDNATPEAIQMQLMRAAANYQMGRYKDARTALADSALDSDRHVALWRGLIDAALENYESAAANFERAAPVINRYRSDVQARVRLAAAEAALAAGRREDIKKQLGMLPTDVPETLKPQVDLVRARYYMMLGDKKAADPLFAAVESSADQRAAAQALYYRIDAGLQSGQIPVQQAINALERLRFRWRGDNIEIRTLNKLASLYFKQKKWREGLRDLRVAAKYFPGSDAAGRAQDQMRTLFSDLFLRGKADSIPPPDALGLFYDFIELTPIGPDGDEMIRHMADRLTAVDLLAPAADLLQYQVTQRLDGMARAQVAAKLAAVQLMDRKPQAALETLTTTQISAMPDDVAHQRLLLQARALADLKRWDEALDLIGVDKSADADRFRADVYWKSGNWPAAALRTEQGLGNRWNDAEPLNDDERQQVLRAAVAYALAGDEASLNRVRARYTAKMNTSADGKAFGIVTQRTDMRGLAFRQAAAQVAAIDTLKGYMKELERPAAAAKPQQQAKR